MKGGGALRPRPFLSPPATTHSAFASRAVNAPAAAWSAILCPTSTCSPATPTRRAANGGVTGPPRGAAHAPDRELCWPVLAQHGVGSFYPAPPANRAFRKWGTD